MPPDEVSTSPAENAEIPPVQNPPQNLPPTEGAPPPAAELVTKGVKSERELELERTLADTTEKLTAAERKQLERERRIMELERDNEELKKIPTAPAPAPEVKPKKVKRASMFTTLIGAAEDENE